MTHIPLVPVSKMPEGLQRTLKQGLQSGMLSSSVPVQVWAHRPAIAQGWLDLLEQFHAHSLLGERLRELVRLKIASITQCQACQLARKSDTVSERDIACLSADSAYFTVPEQAALKFAELFAADYMAIEAQHYEAMAQHYSVEEIAELNMYCALMLAGGRMTYVQKAY
ncbi:carboxymuconolactone decarboxylase family protein [Marinobacter salarius]|jgi:alkylhydroperoxidase family enzyme|uniref:carboxymuconolactone decarboxylase family protein n=1 Tax=Marinobacter TaxID=2742 RepID=UPI001485FED7|nr:MULTISPECIES: carboxymuconolactone decarboxylase family protein [Marinobacter]MDP4533868.1 carboxymuconolactone decarboxylase family protein [Marinobacter salarius]|tara:strand:- start:20211 stop:20714 length:504 start_codon:yes stop_codon:yes gene_type:complete